MTKSECESTLKSRETKLDPDTIFDEIGGFGKFQLFVYVLICFPLMFIVSSNFSYIFIASDLDYRCFIPECDVNFQIDTLQWISKAVPYTDGKISKCERFVAISMNESDGSVCPWNFNQTEVVTCESFVYSTQENILLNEFNLTCEKNEWKLNIVGSLGYLAECMALPFIGLIADKYGRKLTIIWSIVLVSIFGIVKTFTSTYMTFMILHFVGALFGGGAFGLILIFGSELVGPSYRALGAGIIANSFAAAQMFLAVATIYIIDFRVLLRCLFGMIAITLTFIWLLPESPRWLISVGKYKEGLKIIEKMIRVNKSKISIDAMTNGNDLLLDGREEIQLEKYPLVSALKSKILCSRLINCCYCFLTNSLIYFGLSIYSSTLPGNKHTNLLYAGMIEIPVNTATHFVLKRYGRRWSLIISMLTCSAACIASEFLSEPVLKIISFLVGKFTVALSCTILSLYSIELFPTNLRQSMFNICFLFAGFGNIVAPLLPLTKNVMPSLPLILFGGTSFTSALLVLLLPETRNKRMPDSVDEAINI